METILAAIGAFFMSWTFVVGIIIFAVICDYNESKKDEFGWSAWWTIVGIVCLCLLTKPSIYIVLTVIAAWIPAGIVWSFMKWKFRINKTRYDIKSKGIMPNSNEYSRLKDRLDINNVKSTVAYWVLFWPISVTSTCLFNVFESIEYLVTVKLGGRFAKMAEEAFK